MPSCPITEWGPPRQLTRSEGAREKSARHDAYGSVLAHLAALGQVGQAEFVEGWFEPLDQFLTAGGGRDAGQDSQRRAVDACHEAVTGGLDHLGRRALADAPEGGGVLEASERVLDGHRHMVRHRSRPVIPISATACRPATTLARGLGGHLLHPERFRRE